MNRIAKQLPAQLISLIHHIALNEFGWWDKTIQNFIISTIWISKNNNDNDVTKIKKSLKEEFNLEIEPDVIEREINHLLKQGVIVSLDNANYKISEEKLKKFSKDLEDFEILESNSKKRIL